MQRIQISLLLLALLAACAPRSVSTPTLELNTPEVSTATPLAYVARVNGEGITANSYNANVRMFQEAQSQTGTLLATQDAQQVVIDNLVDRLLLAQAARQAGFVADDALLDGRLANITEQAGGAEAFAGWLATFGLTQAAYREELRLELEAAHQVAEISANVPTTAEQVWARQVLLPDQFSAERVLGQLESGTPFETVVINNDPRRQGTLGWFPRGYLLQIEVEAAAFALQPGQYSQVIETEIGFHLIEVLAHEADRPLSPQARQALQTQAVQAWLEQQRAGSAIEILLP
ncbi:MAG: SurA N-terminal domain-containing protein [Anaerolineales bacterium]|nr:SurA N-terminal domain-containing protein [Anaerolineales bacterium]